MKNKYLVLFYFVITFIFPLKAFSISLNVMNQSFEDANLLPGVWNNNVPQWTLFAGSGGSFNGISHFNSIPDGTNTFWSHGGTLSQMLSDVLTANTIYQLRVEIGDANNMHFGGYRVQLWAGTTMLVEDNNTLTPTDGNWLTSNVNYTVLPGNPEIGNNLSIRLISLGAETNFDNVTLDAVPASSSMKLGVCIAPLGVGGTDSCYQFKTQTWCTANGGTWHPELSCKTNFPTVPLLVNINSFNATRNGNGKVKIELVTGSETKTTALHVYRTPAVLQNLQQIQNICQWDSVGTDVSGSIYSCEDENVPANVMYWPAEVENNGTTNNYLEFITNIQ